MRLLRARLALHSPLVSPLQGDTLFGHICWGIALGRGEEELVDFLSRYDIEEPPLVFSNGFPADTLPFPHLTPYLPRESECVEEHQKWKKLKEYTHIPCSFFSQQESFSLPKLKLALENEGRTADKERTVVRMHNTINRISGTTGEEGRLYSQKERWFYGEGKYRDVYIHSTMESEEVRKLLEEGLAFGYGADRSTGKGDVHLTQLEEAEFPDEGNRAMALGNFVPAAEEELEDLRAGVLTKYGKLGEHYVHEKNPFKKPIVMYQAGATWRRSAENPYVGTLLSGVHSDPSIRHHALSPVVFFHEEVSDVTA